MSETVSVLLAVHPPIVRRGIRTFLEAGPSIKVVGETGDGCEALAQASKLNPSVIVLNCRLSMPNWVDVAQTINLKGWPTSSIAYCVGFCDLYGDSRAQVTLRCLSSMLQAGIAGYIEEEHSSLITEAIRTVSRGETWFSPGAVACMADIARGKKGEPAPGKPTERELEVLGLVSRGWSNVRIAQSLGISGRTVAFHLENLLSKLDANNRTEAVVKAVRRKWLELE